MGQVRRMRYSAADKAIYLGSMNASGANYLAKLDISSPLVPAFSYVNIPSYIGALDAANGFVYVNTGVDTRELRAYNTGNLSLAASYMRQIGGMAKEIQVSGSQLHLLFTCGHSALNIGAGTAFSGEMSNGNASVTFVPVSLALDTSYKIRITTDAKAIVGTSLPAVYTQLAAWRTLGATAAPGQVINLASMNCHYGLTYNSQISVQGNVLAISCNTGVLIFQRGGDGQWSLTQTLNALDSTGHYMGAGVSAFSGDYLTVQGIGAGVSIFKKDAGNYFTQTAFLTDPDGNASSGFGLSVAMNSNQLMVGARNAAGGKIHVYEKNPTGENWLLKQSLTRGTGLGDTLATSDLYLVSGGNAGGGYASVFERDAAGNWQFVQDLTGLMYGGRGAALLYERDATTGYWNQISTLVPSDPNLITPEGSYTSDGFADRLMFVGNRPLISGWFHFRSYLNPFGQAATGTIYLFGDTPGWVASETAKIEPPAPYAVGSNNGNAYLVISAIP